MYHNPSISPIHYKIANHLKTSTERDPKVLSSKKFKLIEGIKALGRDYIRSTLKSDFEPTMEQNIAVALYSRAKKLKKMSSTTRENTYAKLNELISNNVISDTTTKERKQKRQSQNLFDSFADSEDEEASLSGSLYCKELSEYLQMPITDKDDRDDSTTLSEWWFKHRTMFPNLFKVFMRISSIPASSAPSERCFSVTRQIISEKRSSILPENVSNIMMVRNLY